jgi:tRNA-specific 2-thiouridylase
MKKRVVVALSGGIDSAVAAALLQEQGYECIGIHLRFWHDPMAPDLGFGSPQNKCCKIEAFEDSKRIADFLNIPFHFMDVSRGFKKSVVDYFLKTYSLGRTPNPCIECNRTIKFGELLKKAMALKADYLATGHYARLRKKAGEFELHTGRDKAKDQSYFLYKLNQKQLKHVLFPLGGLLKTEVRELAKKYKLPAVLEKKESQGLCFFPESTPENFLKRHLPEKLFKNGPIFTLDGRKIGIHKGLPLYTIGQRHGLGIGGVKGENEGEGWYVVNINREKNTLFVGRKKDIFKNELVCKSLHFISGKTPKKTLSIQVKIRHRAELTPAKLSINKDKGMVVAKFPLSAVSSGQAAVFYKGSRVLGGGIIK